MTRVALSMSVGLRIWILRIPPRQPRLEHVAGESAARSIVPVISAWKMFGNGITKFRASPADNVLLLLRWNVGRIATCIYITVICSLLQPLLFQFRRDYTDCNCNFKYSCDWNYYSKVVTIMKMKWNGIKAKWEAKIEIKQSGRTKWLWMKKISEFLNSRTMRSNDVSCTQKSLKIFFIWNLKRGLGKRPFNRKVDDSFDCYATMEEKGTMAQSEIYFFEFGLGFYVT